MYSFPPAGRERKDKERKCEERKSNQKTSGTKKVRLKEDAASLWKCGRDLGNRKEMKRRERDPSSVFFSSLFLEEFQKS